MHIFELHNNTKYRAKESKDGSSPNTIETKVGAQLLCAAIISGDQWMEKHDKKLGKIKLEAQDMILTRPGYVSILQAGPVPFYLKFGFEFEDQEINRKVQADMK